MSRVQLALNVADLDEAVASTRSSSRHRHGKVPPGLRQLRDRRTAAEARAHRRRRRARHAEPPRRRGRRHRRGRSGPRAARAGEGLASRGRGRGRVLLRTCRTRSGSTRPTASRGRSTPSSTTSRCPTASSAPSTLRPAPVLRRAPESAPSAAAEVDGRSRQTRASRRRSAPASSSRSSSGRGSPRSGSRPTTSGLQLLENSIATGAGLIALILAFGSVSGAHFNPVVTPRRPRCSVGSTTVRPVCTSSRRSPAACVGAMVANLMFDLPAVTLSTHDRSSAGVLLGEVVATFGLLLVILGVVRSGRSSFVAVRGRRLHRRRVLVHVVHELRQPCRHHRPHADRTRSPGSARRLCPRSSSRRSSARLGSDRSPSAATSGASGVPLEVP